MQCNPPKGKGSNFVAWCHQLESAVHYSSGGGWMQITKNGIRRHWMEKFHLMYVETYLTFFFFLAIKISSLSTSYLPIHGLPSGTRRPSSCFRVLPVICQLWPLQRRLCTPGLFFQNLTWNIVLSGTGNTLSPMVVRIVVNGHVESCLRREWSWGQGNCGFVVASPTPKEDVLVIWASCWVQIGNVKHGWGFPSSWKVVVILFASV